MRQHVNPLSRFFQLPLKLPDYKILFEEPNSPLHLDIGSARGKFLLNLAASNSSWNFLGVDIRQPLVISAERERERLELHNLRFLFCNANVSLEDWLADLPKDLLQRVSIQFPDPWFKKRHHKRRLLQPPLLLALASALEPGRELFIQSDLLTVIEPMVKLIEMSGCFNRNQGFNTLWLKNNPLHIPSERESYALDKGLTVYRVLYSRNQQPLPTLNSLQESYLTFSNLNE